MLLLQKPAGQVEIPCGLLRTSPETILTVIDFYRRRPGLRAELADGRALTRFAAADRG